MPKATATLCPSALCLVTTVLKSSVHQGYLATFGYEQKTKNKTYTNVKKKKKGKKKKRVKKHEKKKTINKTWKKKKKHILKNKHEKKKHIYEKKKKTYKKNKQVRPISRTPLKKRLSDPEGRRLRIEMRKADSGSREGHVATPTPPISHDGGRWSRGAC